MKRMKYLLFLAIAAGTIQARDAAQVESRTLVRGGSSWNGAALPAYPQGEPEITVLKVTIPPKTALPWHQHPFINAGVLISGELTVETEDHKMLRLEAGDALIELVNTWHHGTNTGDVPAEIIVFYAGTKDLPVTLEKQ